MPVPLGFLAEGYTKEPRRDKGTVRTPAARKEYLQGAAPLSASTPVVGTKKASGRGTVLPEPSKVLSFGEPSSTRETSEDESEEAEESEQSDEEEEEEDDRSASDSGHAAASPPKSRRVTRQSLGTAKPPPPAIVDLSSSEEDSEVERLRGKRHDPVEYREYFFSVPFQVVIV